MTTWNIGHVFTDIIGYVVITLMSGIMLFGLYAMLYEWAVAIKDRVMGVLHD